MSKAHQIRVYQEGSELFAIDCINWPNSTFKHPVVYQAKAMNYGSGSTFLPGWKWIRREQYEWILRHCDCIVECVGTEVFTFYCHNHGTWEKDGQDWPPFEFPIEPPFRLDPDMNEDREV